MNVKYISYLDQMENFVLAIIGDLTTSHYDVT